MKNIIRQLKAGEKIPDSEPRRNTSHSGGYVRLRWLVEKGQYVEAYEHRVKDGYIVNKHVHHKNRNKQDNRSENLEELTHSEHAIEHCEERCGKPPIDAAIIYKMHEEDGLSYPEISKITGYDQGALSRAVTRSGREIKKKDPPNKLDLDLDLIRERYTKGISLAVIAKELNVSVCAIDNRVRKMNLPRHKVGRRPKEQAS